MRCAYFEEVTWNESPHSVLSSESLSIAQFESDGIVFLSHQEVLVLRSCFNLFK